MRVICTGGGFDVEGEVIGGEDFDPITGTCELDSTFTVRCDDGALFQVHGWMVEPRRVMVM
jgi:hypothetical protein